MANVELIRIVGVYIFEKISTALNIYSVLTLINYSNPIWTV